MDILTSVIIPVLFVACIFYIVYTEYMRAVTPRLNKFPPNSEEQIAADEKGCEWASRLAEIDGKILQELQEGTMVHDSPSFKELQDFYFELNEFTKAHSKKIDEWLESPDPSVETLPVRDPLTKEAGRMMGRISETASCYEKIGMVQRINKLEKEVSELRKGKT